jgi:hypothetical protein
VEEVLDAAQLREHVGKRAQRGRLVPARFSKVTGFKPRAVDGGDGGSAR